MFWRSNPILKGHTNFDVLGDLNNKKSIPGYLFTFLGIYIMEAEVAGVCCTATIEAKYISSIESSREIIWFKRILQELGLQQMEYLIDCDSQSAIYLSKNSMYHAVLSKAKRISKLRGDLSANKAWTLMKKRC